MAKSNQIIKDTMTGFIDHMAKVLPDDISGALLRLRDAEKDEAALRVYETMFKNMELAAELDKPLCQDTGIVQFWVRCGANFPALNELEESLTEAVICATEETPLRPNCVETFDEKNTGTNTGTGAPTIWWDILPDRDDCEIYVYLAGGGSSMPGKAEVMMPSAGYEAIVPFVMDRAVEMGVNACPPLIVGVGVGNSVEVAAMNSKKALMRDVGSHNANPKAAELENMLEEGLNSVGIGPQGFGGAGSVMGVNLVNTVRHPATLAVAVNFGCWCHRRGRIVFDKELRSKSETHSGFSK
jgi:L(+)-tartrate dehydratase alpha subunit